MARESTPAALTYDETFTPNGLGLRLVNVSGVTVVHIVFSKGTTIRVYRVRESSSQATAQLTDAASNLQYVAAAPFWSVLWAGQLQNTPASQSTVIESTRERMFDDLNGNGAAYTPSFVGTEILDGATVYHLHLTAADAANHPLTDLFIDEQSLLVRRAVAQFRDTSVAGVTGSLTIDFNQVQNYWLVTSGEVAATVHAFLAQVSGTATFAATNVVVAAR